MSELTVLSGGGSTAAPMSTWSEMPPKALKGVTVVTPWLDHPELIGPYRLITDDAAQVIIIDNGSGPEGAAALEAAFGPFDHEQIRMVIRLEEPIGFGAACNLGLDHANEPIVCFLNNDVLPVAWAENAPQKPTAMELLEACVQPGQLYGVTHGHQFVSAVPIPYIEGWCIAGRTEDLRALGGFDTEHYHGNYWEDNDLCFRAMCAGMTLHGVRLPIQHIGNTTARGVEGAYARSMPNCIAWQRRVLELARQKRLAVTP